MHPSVSLAMILRDAAPTLARCLESVAPFIDEIVIVDTGSVDETCAIARRFTGNLYAFPWSDDFSAARQFAFDRATSEWVMWLDGDDRVSGAERIPETVGACQANVGAIHWKYIARRDGSGNTRCEFWRERCVRNDGSYRWTGKVHETLVPSTPWRSVFSPATVVIHERSAEGSKDRFRNLRILRKEYARTRGGSEPRLFLHMAMELAEVGDESGAVWFLDRFLAASRWEEQNYFAALTLAGLLRKRTEYPGALSVARSAHRRFPEWSSACFAMAHIYHCMQDWDRVIAWSESGWKSSAPNTVCIVDPMEWQFHWIGRYTDALVHRRRLAEARQWTRRALEICPDDPAHRRTLAFLEQSAQTGASNG
ncbi:glycosyltransferase family 2 protein [Caballeronia sp. LZ029]|uniref:tetratricopeptide repeat-containing glycosyltransferase family 2 protein n=1 Tax=Caballeronia sp. LZ029 TaxID=3038564 RepID=UPI002855F3BD|nr:glycosyltransferase family 2 protein [Caballeronia sp. LZ029]MDR5748835.1 glycosyltransferase family 2 protein [Caballeronia sp. LZ029]